MALPVFMGVSHEPGRRNLFRWGLYENLADIWKDGDAPADPGTVTNAMAEGDTGVDADWRVFDPVKLRYVSQMASDVALPPREMQVDEVVRGTLPFRTPKAHTMGNITVKYLDDDSGNVATFHQQWHDTIRAFGPYSLSLAHLKAFFENGKPDDGTYCGYYDGMGVDTLEPFKVVGRVGVFSQYVRSLERRYFPAYTLPVKDSRTEQDIKSYVDPSVAYDDHRLWCVKREIFPCIYPLKVSVEEYSKMDSKSMAQVTVEYVRIPVLVKADMCSGKNRGARRTAIKTKQESDKKSSTGTGTEGS